MSTVEKRTAASSAMVAAAAKGRALMGGTDAMRAAGRAFLPSFEMESAKDYGARLNSSWLFNGVRKTVNDLTGRVFDKSVEVLDADASMEEWLTNVDMQGNDLSTFSVELFRDALITGISYVMVDAPRRDGDVTRQQAQDAGLRPYMTHLRIDDILGWKTATYSNNIALSQLRIAELVQEDDPADEFASVSIKQTRVLDRLPEGVRVRIFRENDGEEYVFDEYMSGASEITVAPFYASRSGFFMGEPVLEDLVDVNIAHWQSQSDQRHILHVARVPILFGSGIPEDQQITISATSAVTAMDPDASLQWVEHSGAAISAGRQDLKDLEFQMEALGLQLLVDRAQTATGAALDAAKETSSLAMMADQLKDTLEQALIWMAEYGGLGVSEATVLVNKEFGVSMIGPQEMTALLSAVNTGQLSRETFLAEMKRRGALSGDVVIADEISRIEQEAPELDTLDGGQ